ncbi:hypothetical protein J6590_022723 [Homalodisca vitripennis]|nr:hypothetical protein J6590_022723 [Homalodisca vitripennis]
MEQPRNSSVHKRLSTTHLCRGVELFLVMLIVLYGSFEVYRACQRVRLVSEQCQPENHCYASTVNNSASLANSVQEVEGCALGTFRLDEGQLRGCPCRTINVTCVIKCCPIGQEVISLHNLTCSVTAPVAANVTEWSPPHLLRPVYYKLKTHQNVDNFTVKESGRVGFFYYDKCNINLMDSTYKSFENTYVVEDGTILTHDLYYLDIYDYCIELVEGKYMIFSRESDSISKIDYNSPEKANFSVFNCVFFIFGLGIIFAIGMDKRRLLFGNLRERLMFNWLTAELFLYLSILVVNCGVGHLQRYYIRFSFLAVLSWLSVMNINLWLAFSQPLRPIRRGKLKPHWGQYIIYSLFGWGVPLLFCILTATVKVAPEIGLPYAPLLEGIDSCPKYSLKTDACFFNLSRTIKLFFYIPDSILILLNILMTPSMLFHMRLHFQDSKNITSSESSQRHAQSSRRSFYVYLVIIWTMGIDWIVIRMFQFDEAVSFLSKDVKMLVSNMTVKLRSRNHILHELCDTTWNSTAGTLRTSVLGPVYSTASKAHRSGSDNTQKVDVQRNETTRIIRGTLRSTLPTDYQYRAIYLLQISGAKQLFSVNMNSCKATLAYLYTRMRIYHAETDYDPEDQIIRSAQELLISQCDSVGSRERKWTNNRPPQCRSLPCIRMKPLPFDQPRN